MMRKLVVGVVALAVTIAFSSPGWSIPIGDVGGADSVEFSALLSPQSEKAELQFITNSLNLNPDGLVLSKIEMPDEPVTLFVEVIGEASGDLWAYDFGNVGPYTDYYLIKLGTESYLNGVLVNTVLYKNIANERYAVLDLDLFSKDAGNSSVDIFRVSHLATVPEPSMLILFGSGLLCLGLLRRRRNQ